MAITRVDDLLTKDDESSQNAQPKQSPASRKRTRTGCLNCRKKRRKCDEVKPTCEVCQARNEVCEWGVKISFRPENAQSVAQEHPSMRLAAACAKGQTYQIVNVTKEIIRDYLTDMPIDGLEDVHSAELTPGLSRVNTHESTSTDVANPSTASMTAHLSHQPTPVLPPFESTGQTPIIPATDLFLSPHYSDSSIEDGIFLPGTQFQELHAALRTRIIDTARSAVPSRAGSPISMQEIPPVLDAIDDEESERLAHLNPEHEYFLLQNYIQEVAPWLDKFDNARHFELVLPILAKKHPHIRYSILALSARQVELQYRKTDKSCSLALYQHAIHLLSPLLQQRTAAVLASCVVLCVLEMMSCSPKAWRRHLDGCAALIQALGINGSCGGLEQALFWCFARMDICGGLISSEPTLIPISKWMSAVTFSNYGVSFDMYANNVVYLTGQVVDFLCSSGQWAQQRRGNCKEMDTGEYLGRWSKLFENLDHWYNERPTEMQPLLTIPPANGSSQRPFQTLLYGNGPATSGNQMYHTSALLMLKHKPPHVQFAKKPHSILWHARQICAISLSNAYHSCWTNCVQPLWIAGQHMSHPSEHKAILDLYERIERETGWATKWRADDLKEYWGELDD